MLEQLISRVLCSKKMKAVICIVNESQHTQHQEKGATQISTHHNAPIT